MESPDLQSKYQKLAAEYSKLRAQNQVLKKAFLEEQTHTSVLSDQLKSQDQSARKAELENDSLIFRNQQLMKRLELLQDDMENMKVGSRKGQHKPNEFLCDGNIDGSNVFTEELQAKIKENAKLHEQLTNINTMYNSRIAELEMKLEASMAALSSKEKLLDNDLNKQKEHIAALVSENLQHAGAIQEKDEENKKLKQEILALRKYGHSTESCDTSETSETIPVLADVPLRDPLPAQLFSNSGSESCVTELIKDLMPVMDELCSTFPKFLLAYKARIEIGKNSTNVNDKHLASFESSGKVWESLRTSYKVLAENASQTSQLVGLGQVCHCVGLISSSLRKLLSIMMQGLPSEVGNGKMENLWRTSFSKFVSSWGALMPYLNAISSHYQQNNSGSVPSPDSIISFLSERLIQLHCSIQAVEENWKNKLVHEGRPADLKAVNENILRHLNITSNCIKRISEKFAADVVPLYQKKLLSPAVESSSASDRKSPCTAQIRQASLEEKSCSTLSPASNLPTSISMPALSDTSVPLAKQLALATLRLNELEAEREHWCLEHQLLQHQRHKESEITNQLKMQLQSLTGSNAGVANESQKVEDNRYSTVQHSIVGEVVNLEAAGQDREKEIREYFTNRCSSLYMQLTEVLSQAQFYQDECDVLTKRLALSEERRGSLEHELDLQRTHSRSLRENLQTTSRNYEEQISAMSEHLADLNEKIASQNEIIEKLHYQLKNKKGKK